MTDLDVINKCLASLGEAPVNAIDTDHPFIPGAVRELDHQLTQLLDEGWYFNTELLELHPDNHQHIYVPADAINSAPVDKGLPYAVRGRRLYDLVKGQYEIDRPVQIWLVRKVPFDDLPSMAQQVVSCRTVLAFQVDFDADRYKAAELRQSEQRAYMFLKKEHIRNIQGNKMVAAAFAAKAGYVLRGGMQKPFPTAHGSWSY